MNKWTMLGFLGVISSSSIPFSVLAGAPGDHRVAARYGCGEVCALKCDLTWNRSKYPPAEPGALGGEPLKAALGGATRPQ
jgi:hypothetical protein